MRLTKNKKKPYIIAEVGQAHDGSLGTAHSYIDAIAESGADAVKFQTHFANEESTFDEPWRIKFSHQDKTRYDYWKRIEFNENQWAELKKHADNKNLDFLSSPFSTKAFNMLKKFNIKYWKIASGEVHNNELMQLCIEDKRPMLISTGLIEESQIKKLHDKLIKKNKKFSLFHCVTKYPTPVNEWNLQKIIDMKSKYRCKIGFSDHSGAIFAGLAAATLFVDFIEVHVTFDKKLFGPDTSSSLNFKELKSLVRGCEDITLSLSSKINLKNIKKNKLIFSRSWSLNKSLKKGTTISEKDLILKKPGTEIPFEKKNEIIGKKLLKNKSKDYLLKKSDLTK